MHLRAYPTHPDRRIRPRRLPSSEPGERKHYFAVSLLLIILLPALSGAAELQPETLAAWTHYIEQVKTRMNSRLDPGSHFLWVDEEPDRARRVRSGKILVAPVNGRGRNEAPNGLIHDWIGAAFFPDATIEKVFATTNEYACYKDFYKPTIIDSTLLSRDGAESSFSMRWQKKALFVTVVMDADFKAYCLPTNEKSRYGFVWSTRIQEIMNYGQASEIKLPPWDRQRFHLAHVQHLAVRGAERWRVRRTGSGGIEPQCARRPGVASEPAGQPAVAKFPGNFSQPDARSGPVPAAACRTWIWAPHWAVLEEVGPISH